MLIFSFVYGQKTPNSFIETITIQLEDLGTTDFNFPTTKWADYADKSWFTGNSDTYTIDSEKALAGLAVLVTEGHDFQGVTIFINGDFDLGEHLWLPIGKNVDFPFKGKFDGQYHRVTSVYLNEPEKDFQGLFGHVVNSEITKVIVKDVNIVAKDTSGGIVANIYNSKLSDSHVDNVKIVVTGFNVGGVAGGILTDSYINNCSATNIDITGVNQVGGIVGTAWDKTEIHNSFATGMIKAQYLVGGLVGFTTAAMGQNRDNLLNNSYSRVNINASIGRAGGVYGGTQFAGIIKNTYSTGKITAPEYLGGFIGITGIVQTENNYYDVDASEVSEAVGGTENGVPPNQEYNITPMNTSSMKTNEFVALLNANQEEAPWTINAGVNDSYPILKSQYISVKDINISPNDLQIYPNPSKGQLNIKTDYKVEKISVYNTEGRLLINQFNKDKINLEHLNSGLYIIEIETNQGKLIKRWMKK